MRGYEPTIDIARIRKLRWILQTRVVFVEMFFRGLCDRHCGFILAASPSSESPRPRKAVMRAKYVSILHLVGLRCVTYARDHRHRFPEKLGELLGDEDTTRESSDFPISADGAATGPTTHVCVAGLAAGLSYVYVGRGLKDNEAADAILAYEPLSNDGDEGTNVLYADAHVEWHSKAEAAKIVAEITAVHNPPPPDKLK